MPLRIIISYFLTIIVIYIYIYILKHIHIILNNFNSFYNENTGYIHLNNFRYSFADSQKIISRSSYKVINTVPLIQTKQEIYHLIHILKKQMMSILLISSITYMFSPFFPFFLLPAQTLYNMTKTQLERKIKCAGFLREA